MPRRRTRRKIGVPFSPLKMRLMGFVSLTAEFFNGIRQEETFDGCHSWQLTAVANCHARTR
jgi:hypothetical protein